MATIIDGSAGRPIPRASTASGRICANGAILRLATVLAAIMRDHARQRALPGIVLAPIAAIAAAPPVIATLTRRARAGRRPRRSGRSSVAAMPLTAVPGHRVARDRRPVLGLVPVALPAAAGALPFGLRSRGGLLG